MTHAHFTRTCISGAAAALCLALSTAPEQAAAQAVNPCGAGGAQTATNGTGSYSSAPITVTAGDVISGTIRNGIPGAMVQVSFLADTQNVTFDAAGTGTYSFTYNGATGRTASGTVDFNWPGGNLDFETNCQSPAAQQIADENGVSLAMARFMVGLSHIMGIDPLGNANPLTGSAASLRNRSAISMTGGGDTFSFAASSAGAQREMLSSQGMLPETMPYDFWIEGNAIFQDDDRAAGRSESITGSVTVGGSFDVSPGMSLTTALVLGRTDTDFASGADAETDTVGLMAQLDFHIGRILIVSPVLGYFHNSVDETLATGVTASFDAQTWIGGAKLRGIMPLATSSEGDYHTLEPRFELYFGQDEADAHVRSDATAVAKLKDDFGLLRFGPEFRREVTAPGGNIESMTQYISLTGDWFFDQTSASALSNDDALSAAINAGIALNYGNGGRAELSGGVFGLGSDVTGAQIGASWSINF